MACPMSHSSKEPTYHVYPSVLQSPGCAVTLTLKEESDPRSWQTTVCACSVLQSVGDFERRTQGTGQRLSRGRKTLTDSSVLRAEGPEGTENQRRLCCLAAFAIAVSFPASRPVKFSHHL